MLGHILRYDDDAPAYLALKFCINVEENKIYDGRLGAPCMNLFNMYRKDLKNREVNNELRTSNDLSELRELARDRKAWKSLCFS